MRFRSYDAEEGPSVGRFPQSGKYAWVKTQDPRPGESIDRIDVNGNYEPSNCRFTDIRTQVINRRMTRFITAFGETKCIADWALDSRATATKEGIRFRLNKGVSPEEAISGIPRQGESKIGGALLKPHQVIEIYNLVASGHKRKHVAAQFGVNPRMVSNITTGLTWKELGLEPLHSPYANGRKRKNV
jgi:hypothetical protein